MTSAQVLLAVLALLLHTAAVLTTVVVAIVKASRAHATRLEAAISSIREDVAARDIALKGIESDLRHVTGAVAEIGGCIKQVNDRLVGSGGLSERIALGEKDTSALHVRMDDAEDKLSEVQVKVAAMPIRREWTRGGPAEDMTAIQKRVTARHRRKRE